MVRHKLEASSFLVLSPSSVNQLRYTGGGKPVYVSQLSGSVQLPAPADFPVGETLLIYLQGNSSGHLWTLSLYDFGQYNDGSSFTPGQSTSSSRMDLLTVHKVSSSGLKAVWHRGLTNVTP